MAICFNLGGYLCQDQGSYQDGPLRVVLDDWAVPEDAWISPLPVLPDTPGPEGFLDSLPDASGEFTGTFDKGEPDG